MAEETTGTIDNSKSLDEFGRDAAERTVELEPRDADAVSNEVTDGEHDTFDDALHYIITRGLAEIKRQREAAKALRDKTRLKQLQEQYARIIKDNPHLAADAKFVDKMLKELGIA